MEYVQVRNLVLSATPSNSAGRSFSYQLSFGSLGGALFPYKGLHENAKLMASPFNEQLKSYLSSRSPPNLPEELHLYLSNIEDASKKEYIVNSIITFVSKFVTDNYDHMDSELFERNPGIPILQSMLTTLDPKGMLMETLKLSKLIVLCSRPIQLPQPVGRPSSLPEHRHRLLLLDPVASVPAVWRRHQGANLSHPPRTCNGKQAVPVGPVLHHLPTVLQLCLSAGQVCLHAIARGQYVCILSRLSRVSCSLNHSFFPIVSFDRSKSLLSSME